MEGTEKDSENTAKVPATGGSEETESATETTIILKKPKSESKPEEQETIKKTENPDEDSSESVNVTIKVEKTTEPVKTLTFSQEVITIDDKVKNDEIVAEEKSDVIIEKTEIVEQTTKDSVNEKENVKVEDDAEGGDSSNEEVSVENSDPETEKEAETETPDKTNKSEEKREVASPPKPILVRKESAEKKEPVQSEVKKEEVEEDDEDEIEEVIEEEIEEETDEEEEKVVVEQKKEVVKEAAEIEQTQIVKEKPPVPSQNVQETQQQRKSSITKEQQEVQQQRKASLTKEQQEFQPPRKPSLTKDQQEFQPPRKPSLTREQQQPEQETVYDADRMVRSETRQLPQQQYQQQYQPQQQLQQQQQQYQQQQQQRQLYQPQSQTISPQVLVSSSTSREETQDGDIKRKSEKYERNEIQNTDSSQTRIQSTRSTTAVEYSNASPYQHQQPQYFDTRSSNYKPQLYNQQQFYDQRHPSMQPSAAKIDLDKIFTPATDIEQIIPKNRTLYASSAFYSPNLHPTVEDQVELARRISHSLSDISNQQSKGQSMYINRKKRSVKWVHEGEGGTNVHFDSEIKENGYEQHQQYDKVPLKLVMNPRGQVRDYSSVRQDFGMDSNLITPDKCAELMAALNAPKGKGAELFAKRRKKSEKWVVDATPHSPTGVAPYQCVSPNILPAYSDFGKQRVQTNMYQDLVQDHYSQPRIKLVKTPWEAALETGSASTAFEEMPHLRQPGTFIHTEQQDKVTYDNTENYEQQSNQFSPSIGMTSSYSGQQYNSPQPQLEQNYTKPSWNSNSQRDLAYKPSIPQGWNAPRSDLPRELYVPKEIPLDGYVPPATDKYLPPSINSKKYLSFPSTTVSNQNQQQNQQQSKFQSAANYEQSSFPSYDQLGQQFGSESTQKYNTSSSNLYSTSNLLSTTTSNEQFDQQQQYRQPSPKPLTHQSFPMVSSIANQYEKYSSSNSPSNFPSKSSTYYSAAPSAKHLSKWKTQQELAAGAAQKNFNPSPLPYEKLAKFEQPDEYDIHNNPYKLSFCKRPTGIRNPVSIETRNFDYTENIPITTSPIQIPKVNKDNYRESYSMPKLASPNSPMFGRAARSSQLLNAPNYNAAARGWGQGKQGHKSIHLDSKPALNCGAQFGGLPGSGPDMAYSDF